MNKTYKAAARLFAALDFTEENARIAELRTEISSIDDALEKAEQRRSEIARALAQNRGPDGAAVADALLAGSEAMEATLVGPVDEDLRKEQASLRAAITDLNRRKEAARRGISELQDKARQRVAECSGPLADALAGEMRQAARSLIDGYAAISALNDATHGHGLVRHAGKQAVAGVAGMDKLLPFSRRFDVPREMIECLEALKGKGEALPARITQAVPAP